MVDSDLEVARARLGRRVGDRWVLERVLGTGGMGAVYAARRSDGAVAAVKILHPEMGARREVRERFLREGTAASTIGHPGVVRMLDQGDGEEAFLAMELLEGETLRDRVKRHGRLPLEEVLDFTEQVLEVLVAAHARGVVHRDLKPDNLFVTLEGRIKVLDFGLARLLEGVPGGHQTRTGVALGTLAYMAPEQALGRRGEIDGRVDVFALGATMFRVLAGRRVHEAESEAELLMAMASRPAPPLGSVAPGTPPSVAAIVDLSLAFSRDARYPDARTMLADVQAVRRGAHPPYATTRLASRDERTRPEQAAAPGVVPAVTVPRSARTQPLSAYTEPTAPYPAGVPLPLSNAPTAYGVAQDAAAPSVRAPISRTEPLPAMTAGGPVAPPPVVAVAVAPAPYVAVPAAPQGAPPAVAWPNAPTPAAPKRGGLLLAVAVGTVSLAALGGVIAYFVLAPRGDASGGANAPLPAALPSAGATALAPPVAAPLPRGAETPHAPAAAPESAPATPVAAAHQPRAKSTASPALAPSANAGGAPAAPVAASSPATPAAGAAAPVAPTAAPAAAAPPAVAPPNAAPAVAPPPPAASQPPAPPAPAPPGPGRRNRNRR